MRLSLRQVLEATRGRSEGAGDREFSSYHTDSREVVPGGLFFALKGSETDGHRFVEGAVARGAAGVVVDRPVEAGDVAVVQVDDTWAALYDLARWVQASVGPLTIGVTGSNGKTSTKEFVAAALAAAGPVLRTEGNLNTETGVPLTMLRLEPEHRYLVLEMGMQGPGEIARLAQLARPSIGVITSIGTVHLEFFDSQESLARAKGELVAALPEDGTAVLPADSPYFDLLRSLTRARVTSFGAGGDVAYTGYEITPDGCRFTVAGTEVRLAFAGRHMASNACAALTAAAAAGVPIAQAAPRLAGVRVGQRLEERPTPEGFMVVDDSYNASPESMLAAFEAVAERSRTGRLYAVLGEMRELGSLAEEAHVDVGRRAGELFDGVCVVDVGRGATLAEAAGGDLVRDRAAAARWVRERAGAGDVVLVKASHGVHLEELVAELAGPS